MADLAATDITVTFIQKRRDNGRTHNAVTLNFGDGALTYPAGGIPINKGNLGCPNRIESLTVFDKGTSGYEWSYDRLNEKLVAMQGAGGSTAVHTHSLFLNQADVVDGAGTRVNAATDLLGANSGADISIAGVANTAGHGGIVQAAALSVAAAAGAQPSTVAIAAQTVKCEVIGW